jgi:hypothetical protein
MTTLTFPQVDDNYTKEVNKLIIEIFPDMMPSATISKQIDNLYELFKYNGPDILVMLQLIKKRLETAFNNNSSKDIKLEDFKTRTILACVVFVVTRGANFKKAIENGTMTEVGKGLITEAVKVLELKEKVGKEKASNNITLSRVAMCFPHYTVAVMKILSTRMQLPVTVNELPFYYHTSVAPSVWTKNEWTKYQAHHLNWLKNFTKLTQAKLSEKTSDETLAKIQEAAYSSKAFPLSFRTDVTTNIENVKSLDVAPAPILINENFFKKQ